MWENSISAPSHSLRIIQNESSTRSFFIHTFGICRRVRHKTLRAPAARKWSTPRILLSWPLTLIWIPAGCHIIQTPHLLSGSSTGRIAGVERHERGFVYCQGWGELLEQHTHTHTHDHIYHPHVTGRELNPYYLVAAYDRLIINRSVVRTPTLSPSIHPPDNYNTALIKETFNRQACRRWIQSHQPLVPKGRFILCFDKTATPRYLTSIPKWRIRSKTKSVLLL